MHNRRCSEAKPPDRIVETQCIASLHSSSPAWGEIIVAVIDNFVLAGLGYHAIMYRRLRCATPTVMHISSLRD
ncbi:MAG: hypothetical protein LBT09_06410 [Planctomycetaceae bacterium]|nr:hypothetical protein [Planctomycetaceae bacterium]